MKRFLLHLIFFISISLLKAETNEQFQFRTMINLADYIANDYPNAVANHKLINEFEYAEMQEFSQKLLETHEDLSKSYSEETFTAIYEDLLVLEDAILNMEDAALVQLKAKAISTALLAEGVLSNVPQSYPDINKGRLLYATYCTRCHGVQGMGDGPSAATLNPGPANFKESTHLFPFHIFNTIQLGIDGTAMLPLSQLSEKETWDIAFYVMTLGFEDTSYQRNLYTEAAEIVDLSLLSNSTNNDLAKLFPKQTEDYLKALRFYVPTNSQEESLDLSLKMLEEAISFYEQGLYPESNQKALDAYFIGFEPVEISLGATNPSKVLIIEKEMMLFRSYLKVPGNDVLLKEQYDKIAYHFESIKSEEKQGGFWFVFLASISILLREGLEALLIIVAILAALNTFANGEQAKKYVHAGWLSAALLGVVSYFFAAKLIAMGSHSRELIEGFGALLAVFILLSVGFWLHDKSNAASWSKYVKSKLSKHVDSNSLWSVAILAFVVVFREAFESVIFLSSLTINPSADASLGVLLGSLFSAAFIIVIGVLIIKFSKRLPIHQVFKISSITMIVLAVILAGRGIKELQEAALLDVNLLNFKFSIDLLGFYPSVQTIAAQIITLLIALGLWYYNKNKQLAQA